MEHVFAVMLVWLLAAAWIFLLVSWAITGEVSAAGIESPIGEGSGSCAKGLSRATRPALTSTS
mgnify:CR=1 FL=1